MESVDFVASLPVLSASSDETAVAARGPSSDTPCASVIGNTLMAWASNVDHGHKTALEAVLAYVQLVAQVGDYRKDPRTDPVGFYHAVVDILSKCGFADEGLSFAGYSAQEDTVRLDSVVSKVLGQQLNQPQVVTVSSALAALNSDANDMAEAWYVFRENSAAGSAGSFSAGLAQVITSGEPGVSMSMSAFSLAGIDSGEPFLWKSYPSNRVSISSAPVHVVISDASWDRLGPVIMRNLGDHMNGYVADVGYRPGRP